MSNALAEAMSAAVQETERGEVVDAASPALGPEASVVTTVEFSTIGGNTEVLCGASPQASTAACMEDEPCESKHDFVEGAEGLAAVVTGSMSAMLDDEDSESESATASSEEAAVEINPEAVAMGLVPGHVPASKEKTAQQPINPVHNRNGGESTQKNPDTAGVDLDFGFGTVGASSFGGSAGADESADNLPVRLPQGPAFADEREYERELARSETNTYRNVSLQKSQTDGQAAGAARPAGPEQSNGSDEEFDFDLEGSLSGGVQNMPTGASGSGRESSGVGGLKPSARQRKEEAQVEMQVGCDAVGCCAPW